MPEGLAFLGLLAFARYRGQDLNYDQLNYHVLYAHLLLVGNVGQADPSLVGQRYLNPLVNVPWTLGVSALSPRALTVAVVAVQTANVALVRRVAEVVVGKGFLALLAAVVGISGPVFLSEVGTSFTDATTSLLVLGGVLLVLSRGRLCLGAALMGAAAGLKLTNAVFVVGLLVLMFWVREGRSVTRWLGLPVLAAAAGAAVTGGAWSIYLWSTTGNPFFPYYNSIFRSSLLPAVDIRDRQFLPSGLGAYLRLPYDVATGHAHVLERPLRDARWLILVALVGLVLVLRARRGRVGSGPSVALAAFALTSGVLWAWMFGYGRYFIPVELLSGVLLAVCVLALLRRRWAATLGLAAVGVGCAAWATVPDWGHSPGFGPSWYSVNTQVLSTLPRGAVVVTDQDAEPVSYAARWLASDAKLVPISQGIAYVQHPEDTRVPGVDRMLGTGLDRAVRDELQRLSVAGRPLFILRAGRDPGPDLLPFGVIEDAGCLSLGGPDGQLRVCPAHLEPSA